MQNSPVIKFGNFIKCILYRNGAEKTTDPDTEQIITYLDAGSPKVKDSGRFKGRTMLT